MIEGSYVKSVKINGNTAILEIVGKDGNVGMGTQQITKIDGVWYLDGLPGTPGAN